MAIPEKRYMGAVDLYDAVDNTVPERWIPFRFEANQAFGIVYNPGTWALIRQAYTDEALAGAKLATYGGHRTYALGERMNFGLRFEHDGDLTLGQWAQGNGMSLFGEAGE